MYTKTSLKKLKTDSSGHITILRETKNVFKIEYIPETIIVKFKKVNSEEVNLFEFTVSPKLSDDPDEIMAFVDVTQENGATIICGLQYPEDTQYEKTSIAIDKNCDLYSYTLKSFEYKYNDFIYTIEIIEITKRDERKEKK